MKPRLVIEELEGRDTPSVRFAFDYGPGFFAEAKPALEYAARLVGERLEPAGGPTTVGVYVGVSSLTGRYAEAPQRAGYFGSVTFGVEYPWHFGVTEAGLNPTRLDFVTIAAHELLHVLGVGVIPGWQNGSAARGVAMSPDGFHFAGSVRALASEAVAQFGTRTYPTAIDFAALGDIGWNPAAKPAKAFETYSVAGFDGLVQNYVLFAGAVVPLGGRVPYHIQLDDLNGDGVTDARLVTPVVGFDFVVDGRTGGVLEGPFLTVGVSVLDSRVR